MNKKHHCRHCGHIFCGNWFAFAFAFYFFLCYLLTNLNNSTKRKLAILKFGIYHPVRVCNICFDKLFYDQTANQLTT